MAIPVYPRLELVAVHVACQACAARARFRPSSENTPVFRAWYESHRMPVLVGIDMRVNGVLRHTEVRRTLSR